MKNTRNTTDQGFQNNMLTIQSSLVQHSNTIPEGSDLNIGNQPDSTMLIDDNGSNINPGLVHLPTYVSNASHKHFANTIESQNDVPAMIFTQQLDITKSRKIQFKFQPRQTDHPRTLKENKNVSHYIRCEECKEADYPTIYTICEWQVQSTRNYIEVALVDIFEQPHPYTITNNEIDLNEGPKLVMRATDGAPNLLYFAITDTDFENGCKTFKIQLIKDKQNGDITGKSIRERQLEKSMLRFTRTFYDEHDKYHRDEASTAYSCVMTYGDLRVDCINPTFGPMGGNQLLTVVFTGFKVQDRKKLSFEIFEQNTGWKFKIAKLKFVGNTISFSMPGFPNIAKDNTMTSVIVYYQGEAIYESPFLYVPGLDRILDDFNLNAPNQIDANSTTLNDNFCPNQDLAGSSRSSSTVPKKSSKNKSKKRWHED